MPACLSGTDKFAEKAKRREAKKLNLREVHCFVPYIHSRDTKLCRPLLQYICFTGEITGPIFKLDKLVIFVVG